MAHIRLTTRPIWPLGAETYSAYGRQEHVRWNGRTIATIAPQIGRGTWAILPMLGFGDMEHDIPSKRAALAQIRKGIMQWQREYGL